MSTILDMLARHARANPQAPAIGTLGRPILSYSEFFSAACAIRRVLHAYGLGPRSRVALIAPDGPQMLFGILAVATAAQALPIAADSTPGEIRDIIDRGGCSALIVHRDVAMDLSSTLDSHAILYIQATSRPTDPAGLWRLESDKQAEDRSVGDPGPDDAAFIMTSSGTTGRPKLIPRTHGNLAFCDGLLIKDLGLGPDDVALACMPQHHSMGSIGTTHPIIRAGGFAVCAEGPFAPVDFIKHLHAFQPSYFSAGPVYLRAIVREIARNEGGAVSKRLRFIRTGTDALPADLRVDVEKMFGVPVHAAYGMSETGPIAHRSTDGSADRPGLLGRLLLDQVAVMDDDGVILRDGGEGEIIVAGKSVSPHYIGDAALNREAYVDGWLRTGDLGFIDGARNIYYAGRKKDLINRGGFKVAPVEVERAILQHPAVAEAAVFPIAHPTLGEEICIAIVEQTDMDFDERELELHLSGLISREKWPRHMNKLQALPRNDMNKVQRDKLTALYNSETVQLLRDRQTLRRGPNGGGVAPRNDLEIELRDIWVDLLGVDEIGVEDDFFVIGGDSLSAIQLIMEIEKRFDLEFNATDMLERVNTIAGMGAEIVKAVPMARKRGRMKRETTDVDFAEFEERIRNTNKPTLYYIDPETKLRRAKPNVTLGSIETNSLGFRSPEIERVKPSGTVRIAFLGTSTTFDSAVSSNAATWPYQVCSHLRDAYPSIALDFVNGALPGLSTAALIEHFRHYIAPMSPDITVIRAMDINRDTAYLAREQGLYSGVHHAMSWLGRQSSISGLVEKNLVVAYRMMNAYNSRRKLRVEAPITTGGFESRLTELVQLCQQASASVVLINADGALRSGQSRWCQLWAAGSYLYYMPYLTIPAMLQLQGAYQRAVRDVVDRTGCGFVDCADTPPADRVHFADSSHYRDAGSRLVASVVSGALITQELLPRASSAKE